MCCIEARGGIYMYFIQGGVGGGLNRLKNVCPIFQCSILITKCPHLIGSNVYMYIDKIADSCEQISRFQ